MFLPFSQTVTTYRSVSERCIKIVFMTSFEHYRIEISLTNRLRLDFKTLSHCSMLQLFTKDSKMQSVVFSRHGPRSRPPWSMRQKEEHQQGHGRRHQIQPGPMDPMRREVTKTLRRK